MSLSCLSHSFVYLLYFCPNRTEGKINKQGCGLARKGHGNEVKDKGTLGTLLPLSR